MTEYELDVEGMSCGGCESNVEDAISALEGATDVAADHEADRVEVSGAPGLEDDLEAAVREAGYEPA
jgi:copper chaperone